MPKPRPICVPCKIEMCPEKNDVSVTNGKMVWYGDRYQCPHCSHQMITGFGGGIISSEPSDLEFSNA